MRIGIFGGTFNPPHLGHLLIAGHVGEALALDKILFVPAAQPPHKLGDMTIAPNEHRVAMLLRAIKHNPVFDISTIEIDREGISYTIDTVRTLSETYRGAELFFLMGSDNLAEFHTWRDPDGICALARLVVMQREGFDVNSIDARRRKNIVAVRTPVIEISGTEIRERVRLGKSIRYYVTDDVAEYIEGAGLYR